MFKIVDFINLKILMLSSATDYNIFANMKFKQGYELIIQVGKIMYNLLFYVAIAFFAFKTLKGLYQYFSNHDNPQLRAQYKSDAIEPAKGLILFMLGTTLFNILVFLLSGTSLGIIF